MSHHRKIAAGLHIAAGCFLATLIGLLWVSAALLAPIFEGSWIPDLIAAVGRPVALALLACAGLEVAAAIAWLRQRRWAPPALVALGCLQLLVFPFGTALALYTFCVLAWQAQHNHFTSVSR